MYGRSSTSFPVRSFASAEDEPPTESTGAQSWFDSLEHGSLSGHRAELCRSILKKLRRLFNLDTHNAEHHLVHEYELTRPRERETRHNIEQALARLRSMPRCILSRGRHGMSVSRVVEPIIMGALLPHFFVLAAPLGAARLANLAPL